MCWWCFPCGCRLGVCYGWLDITARLAALCSLLGMYIWEAASPQNQCFSWQLLEPSQAPGPAASSSFTLFHRCFALGQGAEQHLFSSCISAGICSKQDGAASQPCSRVGLQICSVLLSLCTLPPAIHHLRSCSEAPCASAALGCKHCPAADGLCTLEAPKCRAQPERWCPAQPSRGRFWIPDIGACVSIAEATRGPILALALGARKLWFQGSCHPGAGHTAPSLSGDFPATSNCFAGSKVLPQPASPR